MTTDQTTPYPLRDLTPPELPSRSRLYYLEPIGVGTAQVESLTSYLSRLARAHSVSSRRLAMAEMATLLDHHYPGEVTTSTFWLLGSSQEKSTYSGARTRRNGDNPQYQDKGVGREL